MPALWSGNTWLGGWTMTFWQELAMAYLTLAGIGITYCLSRLAIEGYRAGRMRVTRWRIHRMR